MAQSRDYSSGGSTRSTSWADITLGFPAPSDSLSNLQIVQDISGYYLFQALHNSHIQCIEGTNNYFDVICGIAVHPNSSF